MATTRSRPPEHPQKPWVGRVLTDWWPTLRDAVGSDRLMPRSAPRENPRRKRVQLREYGCGYYGCVFPTGNSGLVFKVTTDSSEAAFVAAARTIEAWPHGMVLYTNVWQLAGEKHGRRPVYVLWREAAGHVGELLRLYDDGIPQRKLGRAMHISPASVTNMLQRMERSGWVKRVRDEEDQRVVRVFLTPKAQKLREEAASVFRQMESELNEVYTAAEQATLKRLLLKLHARFAPDAVDGSHHPPFFTEPEGRSP